MMPSPQVRAGIYSLREVISFARDFSGGYLLIIRLAKEHRVYAGSVGRITLRPGFYVYAGSALGGTGWRLIRHTLKNRRKLHWHIDRLLSAPEARVTSIGLLPSRSRVECYLSNYVFVMSDESVHGFGSTDCDCLSHLHYFKRKKDALDAVKKALERASKRP